jgi:hypothetical protein
VPEHLLEHLGRRHFERTAMIHLGDVHPKMEKPPSCASAPC